jgi:hypothetical protein
MAIIGTNIKYEGTFFKKRFIKAEFPFLSCPFFRLKHEAIQTKKSAVPYCMIPVFLNQKGLNPFFHSGQSSKTSSFTLCG